MASRFTKILAIVDPTTDDQRALARAVRLARAAGAAVHAYLCCHSRAETDDHAALRRAEIRRNELWLDALIAGLGAPDVAITTEVEWNENWRDSFAGAAARNHCDAIVKSTFSHAGPRRRLLKTSDWSLLRAAQCPVMLVKRGPETPVGRVLVAVNPGVADAAHRRLNEALVDLARRLAGERGDGELHAVCAYAGTDTFTHPPELAEIVGIDVSRAHCRAGDPDDVIAETAKTLDAGLVIVGTVARTGLEAVTRGNTAERLLDRLESDVLVVTA